MTTTLLLFITVPLVTAVIGYVTNWAAVKMIFNPREPIGVGALSWQGIVYKLAPKFAAEIATTTGHVLSPADLVERLDLPGLIGRLEEAFPAEFDALVAEALDVVAPGVWDGMATEAREQVRRMIVSVLADAGQELAATLTERADSVVDLDRLIVEELSGENADRLARVAEEIGQRELRFIEWYGGVFGFGVGVVQAAAFSVFGLWWTMPIVGAVVGLGTNWLAIQMIFRPLEPRRFLGIITYQGMFPKRQSEIAADYGRIAGGEILTPANLIDHVSTSSRLPDLREEVGVEIRTRVASLSPMLEMLAGSAPSDDDLVKLEHVLQGRIRDLAPAARPVVEAHLAASLRLEELIEDRLSSLDKLQFERMLRGIFEEDEIILIAIGGVLGGAMGALQGAIVLGAGW